MNYWGGDHYTTDHGAVSMCASMGCGLGWTPAHL